MRLVPLTALVALILAGCGGDTTTVTETQSQDTAGPTQSTSPATTTTSDGATVTVAPAKRSPAIPAGNRGPHYFETPSHNIGCFISAHDARCDIRQRAWSPPPEPKSCIKFGVDYGQGLVVGPNHAEFVCAGDTTLGGPVILPYRASAQRGTILCVSRTAGMTCRNTTNGHGFFLSRASYRIF